MTESYQLLNPKLKYQFTYYGLIAFCLLLTACSSKQYGRYQQKHDSIPTRLPNQSEMQNPQPRVEPLSRGGNKNYQVRGKSYQVLKSADGFQQTGIASWYGKKFHGHLTSNGETYDMYGMTAAHKNLPLPSYVKVTNLKNQKTAIVRVNDRGPFHQGRIIDLSYSAAHKLGMLKTGTAQVKVEVIKPETSASIAKQKKISPKIAITDKKTPLLESPLPQEKQQFIQVFATRNPLLAKNTANALNSLYQMPVSLPEEKGLYRVQIGPFSLEQDIDSLLSQLKDSGYPYAFIKSR